MRQKKIPYITIILIAINVLVFIAMSATRTAGDVEMLYRWGAMYVPAVLGKGEWYRVIAHMFLHSGFEHLLNNMFMLAVIGSEIETVMSRWKYVLIYFVSGIGGTILSAYSEIISRSVSIGVGASGCIMGLAGALIMIMIKSSKMSTNNIIRLIIVLGLMVFGNMEEGIDWMAHLGGAVTGLLLGLILYRRKKENRYE